MDNNETKKSYEELADEALDKVAGGQEVWGGGMGSLLGCSCFDCEKSFTTEQLELRDGNYYCPLCHKRLW